MYASRGANSCLPFSACERCSLACMSRPWRAHLIKTLLLTRPQACGDLRNNGWECKKLTPEGIKCSADCAQLCAISRCTVAVGALLHAYCTRSIHGAYARLCHALICGTVGARSGERAVAGGVCTSSRCCQSPGFTCYSKNEFFARCLSSCPGLHSEHHCTLTSSGRPPTMSFACRVADRRRVATPFLGVALWRADPNFIYSGGDPKEYSCKIHDKNNKELPPSANSASRTQRDVRA